MILILRGLYRAKLLRELEEKMAVHLKSGSTQCSKEILILSQKIDEIDAHILKKELARISIH